MKGECSAARGAHEDAFAMASQGHASTVDAHRLGHGLGVHVVNVRNDDREEASPARPCRGIVRLPKNDHHHDDVQVVQLEELEEVEHEQDPRLSGHAG